MKYVFAIMILVWTLVVLSVFSNVQAINETERTQEVKKNLSPNRGDLILIKGGTFRMGDVFGEGKEDELPVHNVKVADFFLAPCEVTVAQFRAFTDETGYITSAEAPQNFEAQKAIFAEFPNAKTNEERAKLTDKMLSYGGTFCWDTEFHRFGYDPEANWRNPGFKQSDSDPVVCLSWDDAMHYCNWLSSKEGLPVAYDIESRELLDKDGNRTSEVAKVKGYRLPSEAEWEFAAREGGKDVRFGNGNNIATAEEINFRADAGEYEYSVNGEYRKTTTPVGSFPANGLGLFDMSGNAWEWCDDVYMPYYAETFHSKEQNHTDNRIRVIRGGRWGGDAKEIRVFARDKYEASNRCNNSGFRIAKSK